MIFNGVKQVSEYPLTLTLASGIFCGAISGYLAHRDKKNPYLWFFAGFLFGLLGVFFLFYLSFSKKKKNQEKSPIPILRGPQDKFWYYLDQSHNQVGPVSYNTILESIHGGKLSKKSYVWNETEADWKRLGEFLEI